MMSDIRSWSTGGPLVWLASDDNEVLEIEQRGSTRTGGEHASRESTSLSHTSGTLSAMAETAADASAEGNSTWRELAVARSLDPARVRAEKRVQRFLDAALELMESAPDKEFTVQEVVERSGQS